MVLLNYLSHNDWLLQVFPSLPKLRCLGSPRPLHWPPCLIAVKLDEECNQGPAESDQGPIASSFRSMSVKFVEKGVQRSARRLFWDSGTTSLKWINRAPKAASAELFQEEPFEALPDIMPKPEKDCANLTVSARPWNNWKY